MEKKKLIRIEPIEGLYCRKKEIYKKNFYHNLEFAFVGATDEIKDGIRYKQQITNFFACREQLCEIPRALIHNNFSHMSCATAKDKFDNSTLRLLIGIDERHKDNIFSAKKIINILEESVNWKKSVITSVKHTILKEDSFLLVTGPEQWVRVPQMLSLICLIFRLGKFFGPFKADTVEDVINIFKELSTRNIESQRTLDQNYLSTVKNHILKLMMNLDKVFDEPSSTYYTAHERAQKGWNGYGGIDTLLKCSTGNPKLTDNVQKYIFEK